MAARDSEGLPGILLPGGGMEADGLIGTDAHRERHPWNGVWAFVHRGGAVLGINLAVEKRCRR